MRRRKVAPGVVVPRELRVFDWRAWGHDRHTAAHAWHDARKEYWQVNPDAWPDFITLYEGFAVHHRGVLR